MTTISVSQYIDLTNETLVTCAPPGTFEIEGEVASFGISGGQWVRFDLKDGEAIVNCFLTAWQLKEQVADGMKIAVTGYGKVYPKYGKFSFVVQSIRLSGEGSLRRAFELLQKKLQAEGLFELARKRQLPQFPQHVALITSRDAAAYTDFLRVSSVRWPLATIHHFNVGVQGDKAVPEVVAAIRDAGSRPDEFDVMVVTRGGGSMEDLHVFNTEEVARAIFASHVPVVTGVGHERDVTIVDMVADVRAATPSNAAELIFPDMRDILGQVSHMTEVQSHMLTNRIARDRARVQHITSVVDRWLQSLCDRVRIKVRDLAIKRDGIEMQVSRQLESVVYARRILDSLHPKNVLRRGYSYTKANDGRIIANAAAASKETEITQVYYDGEVTMEICKK